MENNNGNSLEHEMEKQISIFGLSLGRGGDIFIIFYGLIIGKQKLRHDLSRSPT